MIIITYVKKMIINCHNTSLVFHQSRLLRNKIKNSMCLHYINIFPSLSCANWKRANMTRLFDLFDQIDAKRWANTVVFKACRNFISNGAFSLDRTRLTLNWRRMQLFWKLSFWRKWFMTTGDASKVNRFETVPASIKTSY